MQDVCHYIGGGIDSVPANHVEQAGAGKLLPRKRIVDRRVRAEVAAQLGRSRDFTREGNSISTGESLVVEEEERTLFKDRSTKRSAELVLHQLRAWDATRIVEEVVRIEDGIPQIFVQAAMKGVRA